jgi:hypothetical protein
MLEDKKKPADRKRAEIKETIKLLKLTDKVDLGMNDLITPLAAKRSSLDSDPVDTHADIKIVLDEEAIFTINKEKRNK